jgi:hypothetical protein
MPLFRRRPRPPGSRRRFGFSGPFPTYRTRTRRGADVSVSGCGCCLPIPLLTVLLTVAGSARGVRALWRWAHR